MMKETMMNNQTELYATLARINAGIIAQQVERDEWVAEYDRKHPIG